MMINNTIGTPEHNEPTTAAKKKLRQLHEKHNVFEVWFNAALRIIP